MWLVAAILMGSWLFGAWQIARMKPQGRYRPKRLGGTVALPWLVAMDWALGAGPNRLNGWQFAMFVRWKLRVRRAMAWCETGPKRHPRESWIRASLRRLIRPRGGIALANAPESGVHEGGRITKKADAAIALRNALVKVGSDANHIAVAGAAEFAIGVCTDEPTAAEEIVNVQLLACSDRTVLMVTNGAGAIVAGDLLAPAASGKVAKLTAGAGNHYVVGVALESPATTDGEKFEVLPLGVWKTQ